MKNVFQKPTKVTVSKEVVSKSDLITSVLTYTRMLQSHNKEDLLVKALDLKQPDHSELFAKLICIC